MFGAKSFSRYRSVHFTQGLSDDLGATLKRIYRTEHTRGKRGLFCVCTHLYLCARVLQSAFVLVWHHPVYLRKQI